MPNWVTNKLIFKNHEDTRKVLRLMWWHNKRFSFKAIRPHPITEEECEAKHLIRNSDPFYQGTEKKPWFNWYTWHIQHWGCKWDCSDTIGFDNTIKFQTPWDPPCDELLQAIADKFQVEFTIKAWDELEDEEKEPTKFQKRTFKPAE